MTLIAAEQSEHASLLRLANGPTNAINSILIHELRQAAAETAEAGKGLVLAGGEKFFSIGLDLPELLKLDRPAMQAFWKSFEDLQLELFCLPVPTASAIAGHATAGGLILSLCTDLRFVASGRKLMGLNELQIGIMVPWLTHLMLEHRVGAAKAYGIESSGAFMGPEEAKTAGLADEVLAPEELEARATVRVSKLAQLPRQAFMGSKDNWAGGVRERFLSLRKQKEEALLDSWFSLRTQGLLAEAAKKF